MRFLHAADIHLDSPLQGLERYPGAPLEALRGATRRAFVNLVELALAESVDLLLLAGDLYDGDWKDYNTGLFFIAQIQRLHAAGIPVCLIAGNHDAASQITRTLRLPDNVHVFATERPETRLFETLGVAVHGQGFATRAVTTDLSRAYPPPVSGLFNIGLLHTSLDGRPGHAPYAPCRLEALRSHGYDYWALGHVHAREVLAESPWIVFPGNLQGRHIRECGAKGATLVEIDRAGGVCLEHRALDVVRWHLLAVEIEGCTDLDAVHARIGCALERVIDQAEGRLLAVRLALSGATALDAWLRAEHEQLVNDCRGLASVHGDRLWLEQVRLQTRQQVRRGEADETLGGLLAAIETLELDPEALARLAEGFEPLAARLPAGLRRGEDDPTDPAVLRACLDDVRALLRARLLESDPR
ncbi:DNA repair exonuclease [Marichromatium sp. PS1]|uniref:metallophosphoesterase family protein n=1 Tax=Marichromatium sp. PS1 TaxID=3138932 RepID=UPI0032E66552